MINYAIKRKLFLNSIVVLFTSVPFLPDLCFSGQLEPGASPGSTMHTLEDIYNKLVLMSGPSDQILGTPIKL